MKGDLVRKAFSYFLYDDDNNKWEGPDERGGKRAGLE